MIASKVEVLMDSEEFFWKQLLGKITRGKCVPFIGAGTSYPHLPLAGELAYKLSLQYGYPLEDKSNLSRVAQFMAIENENELFPKDILRSELGKIKPPDFSLEENRYTPHAVLADLKVPVYITTNYDYFMEEALESRGKKPVSEFCRWNERLHNYAREAGIPSIFDRDKKNINQIGK